MMIFSNLHKSSLLQVSMEGFQTFWTLLSPESEPHNLDVIPVQRKNVQLSHNEPVGNHKIRARLLCNLISLKFLCIISKGPVRQ